MGPTGKYNRILQIHPTRQCNLHCLHCYSSSSPQEREEISVDFFLQAISDANQEGYNIVSFSGGEPLLYQSLFQLLEYAHQCQMRTVIASNGMLLTKRNIQKLSGFVDLLAISLDGTPTTHNRMRGSEKAFETMASRLEDLRQSIIPFGFIFTLTKYNFRQLDWVANFALEQGASLLQIHPLEPVGRAQLHLAKLRPNESLSAYAYFKAMDFRKKMGDRLYIQVDLAHQDVLRSNPSRIFAEQLSSEYQEGCFADILSPLIIEADGTVTPIQYGFARKYILGNLQDAPLNKLIPRWFNKTYPSFLRLCQQVYQEVTMPAELPIVDWYEAITRQAEITSS